MAAASAFAEHCAELLAPLGAVRVKRMFGGWGFYVDDVFVALAAAERLYLKTDDPTRAAFAAAGSVPFTFVERHGQTMTTGYWTAPADALESPALMLPWARLAMDAALRARSRPRVRRAAAKKTAAATTPDATRPPAAKRRRAAPR